MKNFAPAEANVQRLYPQSQAAVSLPPDGWRLLYNMFPMSLTNSLCRETREHIAIEKQLWRDFFC